MGAVVANDRVHPRGLCVLAFGEQRAAEPVAVWMEQRKEQRVITGAVRLLMPEATGRQGIAQHTCDPAHVSLVEKEVEAAIRNVLTLM